MNKILKRDSNENRELKGALSRQFCYILDKTAQIFDKESVF